MPSICVVGTAACYEMQTIMKQCEADPAAGWYTAGMPKKNYKNLRDSDVIVIGWLAVVNLYYDTSVL